MRERVDRRHAVFLGVALALMAFTNDLLLDPPTFVEDVVAGVVDKINGASTDQTEPRPEAPVDGSTTTRPTG